MKGVIHRSHLQANRAPIKKNEIVQKLFTTFQVKTLQLDFTPEFALIQDNQSSCLDQTTGKKLGKKRKFYKKLPRFSYRNILLVVSSFSPATKEKFVRSPF